MNEIDNRSKNMQTARFVQGIGAPLFSWLKKPSLDAGRRVLRKFIPCIAIALPVILGLGCTIALTDGEISPSVSQAGAALASHPSSTPALTPTSLLSIVETATTPTEMFAITVMATHPYSEELLFAPFSIPLEYRFTETAVGSDLDWRSDYIANSNETFRAFTACDSDLCHERIFIESIGTGQTFEFSFSGRLNWRPILHMRWLESDVLVFDQWSQPHYGFAFVVDVREQELLLVIHMTDECFAYGTCG